MNNDYNEEIVNGLTTVANLSEPSNLVYIILGVLLLLFILVITEKVK